MDGRIGGPILLLLLVLVSCSPRAVRGQEAFEPTVEVSRLGPNAALLRVHHVADGWVNSILVTNADESLLVDHAGDWRTLTADSALVAAVRTAMVGLDVHELRYLVNTHWHGDHSGGNTVYPGAVVIARARTADRIEQREDRGVPWVHVRRDAMQIRALEWMPAVRNRPSAAFD